MGRVAAFAATGKSVIGQLVSASLCRKLAVMLDWRQPSATNCSGWAVAAGFGTWGNRFIEAGVLNGNGGGGLVLVEEISDFSQHDFAAAFVAATDTRNHQAH
jgi:hypothetical protein